MIFIDHTDVLEGQVAVVDISGPLDSSSSTEFEEYANKILDGDTRYLIFNMQKVEYISSAGIGLMLYLQKTVNRLGGYLVLFQINEEIRSLFFLLGFEHILTIAESRIEAMEIIDRQMEIRETGEPEVPEEHLSDDSPEETPEAVCLDDQKQSIEYIIPEKESLSARPDFKAFTFDPFIIECSRCMALIRISEPGTYMCPDCHASFSVDEEMSISYQ